MINVEWWSEFVKVFCSLFLDSINKFNNLILVVITGCMFWATKRSSKAAEKSAKFAGESAKATKEIADDTKKSRRPYLVFHKSKDVKDRAYCYGVSGGYIKFPYVLKNTGSAAAINVKRNHYVVRNRKEDGKTVCELLVRCLLDGERFECSVVPDETSAVHYDDVCLKSAKDNVEKLRIIYHIKYKSDIPNDGRCFDKIVTFELLPSSESKFIDRKGDRYVLDATRLIMPTIQEKRPSEDAEGYVFDIEGFVDCLKE